MQSTSQTTMSQAGSAQEVTADSSDFQAVLTGQNEVPDSVQTNASGDAYFKVNSDSTELHYTIDLSNADSVTMAHIHYGTSSENGPIAVWLFPGPKQQSPSLDAGPVNGVLKSGIIDSTDLVGPLKGKSIGDLIQAINSDSAYVQVHTKAHPEGEIRGQVGSGNQ
ncbi:MAG TPA: CHRD domain-containing protein [Balneolaceae bacterium]|nr:CHRD domain-containing protein [Balneolaceae bacterium]